MSRRGGAYHTIAGGGVACRLDGWKEVSLWYEVLDEWMVEPAIQSILWLRQNSQRNWYINQLPNLKEHNIFVLSYLLATSAYIPAYY